MSTLSGYPKRDIVQAKQRILDEFNRRPNDRKYYFEKKRRDAYDQARHLRAQGQYAWAKHWDAHGDSLLAFYENAVKEAGRKGVGKASVKSTGRLYVEPINLAGQRMGRPLGKHRSTMFQNVALGTVRGGANKHYVKWRQEQEKKAADEQAMQERLVAEADAEFAALQRMS